jgi:hypothetical protein
MRGAAARVVRVGMCGALLAMIMGSRHVRAPGGLLVGWCRRLWTQDAALVWRVRPWMRIAHYSA